MDLIYDAGLDMKMVAELLGNAEAARMWSGAVGNVRRRLDGRKVIHRPKEGVEFLEYAIVGLTSNPRYNGYERMKEDVRPIRCR